MNHRHFLNFFPLLDFFFANFLKHLTLFVQRLAGFSVVVGVDVSVDVGVGVVVGVSVMDPAGGSSCGSLMTFVMSTFIMTFFAHIESGLEQRTFPEMV